MTGQWITGQMDYVFFVYGLAFLLLARSCATRSWERPAALPWGWLGLFGLVHGLHEWMELLALALGDSPVFVAIRQGMLFMSFGALLEFGRRSGGAPEGRSVGPWIYVPIAGLVIACGARGGAGLNAGLRYGLGLPGAMMAGRALLRGAPGGEPGRSWGTLGAVAMFGYALATGLVVGPAPFFPASWLNTETFQAATGAPIQLVRALLACLISFGLWMDHEQWRRRAYASVPPAMHYGTACSAVAMTALLAAGWMAAEWVGRHVVALRLAGDAGVLPIRPALGRLAPIAFTLGVSVLLMGFLVAQRRLRETGEGLKNALAEVKTLRGLLPICANCKKIRDDDGRWVPVEGYIQDRSEALFSHGLCPDCIRTLYPDFRAHRPIDRQREQAT